MDKIKEKIRIIEDSRHQGYVEHKLADILVVIMYAVFCGIDELCEIIICTKQIRIFEKYFFNRENAI